MSQLTRRDWLKTAGTISLSPALSRSLYAAGAAAPPKRIAAISTAYTRNSHSDVIIGKVLEGWKQDGGDGPDLKIVSMFNDQVPKNDLSRDLQKKHGFKFAKTIDEAITLGTDELQVDGVLSVGEHGSYPFTPDTRQHMYPRKRFFDGITAAFKRVGKVAPVFSDKHLAWNWVDAKAMYDTSKAMKIPFMAGSSLPTCWRRPAITLPMGCEIDEAVAVGYGGLESYGFHALETLQCMIERRKGGETGVRSVQVVQGEAMLQAEKDGRWSRGVVDAALKTLPYKAPEDWVNHLGKNAAFFLIQYRDGTRASVAMLNGIARQFGFAAKLKNQPEPVATYFELMDNPPWGHFEHLLRGIDHMFQTGKPAFPVERTLLTTGILDTAMHSAAWDSAKITTPHLGVTYTPADWTFANRDEA